MLRTFLDSLPAKTNSRWKTESNQCYTSWTPFWKRASTSVPDDDPKPSMLQLNSQGANCKFFFFENEGKKYHPLRGCRKLLFPSIFWKANSISLKMLCNVEASALSMRGMWWRAPTLSTDIFSNITRRKEKCCVYFNHQQSKLQNHIHSLEG